MDKYPQLTSAMPAVEYTAGGECGKETAMETGNAESYRILAEGGTGELVEKKSRFLATLRPVATEAEAEAFITEMKKKYWDASHNCSAFVLGPGAELTRCSDDGEPSGTAGRPMLEALLGERVRNAAVVVTRYFGGTLLGTGGLARAYTGAVKAGLAGCVTAVMRHGFEIAVETDYNGIGKILYLLGQRGLEPVEADYGEQVRLTLRVPAVETEALEREVMDATGGKAGWNRLKELYYIDKEEPQS